MTAMPQSGCNEQLTLQWLAPKVKTACFFHDEGVIWLALCEEDAAIVRRSISDRQETGQNSLACMIAFAVLDEDGGLFQDNEFRRAVELWRENGDAEEMSRALFCWVQRIFPKAEIF